MKKLAIVVMMIAIATFMAAAMASADGHGYHSWGIDGEYAMTGPGSCLYSHSAFDPTKHTLPATADNWIASKLTEGTWTFERDGTGKAQYNLHGIAASQAAFPTATGDTDAISFEFTYTIADDGTITGELVPGTYVDTFVKGPYAGLGLWSTFDQLSFFGRVSTDHKTLTLNSANEVQKADIFKITSGGTVHVGTLYEICNYGRVLIRVSDEESSMEHR
jgi:hypothetical protein